MPLRLLEVTVPVEDLEKIPTLVQDVSVLHMRASSAGDDTGVMSILLEAQNVEAASDLLATRFESSAAFRLVLLPVEATLPVPSQPPDAEPIEGGEAGKGKAEAQAQRISREELYEDIAEASRLSTTYVVMVALSTVVAAVGLIRGDVAIVIGAMVIAPLLGPNVALSLAVTLGDMDLARRSLKAIGAGVATALSLLAGNVLYIDPTAPELAARTRPDIGDVVLALAAGTAGSLAFTSGVPAVVVGVMVAIALLPPLVVAGLLVGAGYWDLATGAFVLLLTNVTCLNLAAVATFFLQKVRPRTWWEADRAKRSTRLGVALWTLMLGLLLALIHFGYVGEA